MGPDQASALCHPVRSTRWVIDVDRARMVATGRNWLAVFFPQLVWELFQSCVSKAWESCAHSDSRVAILLDLFLELFDGGVIFPIGDDLDIALAAHVNVGILHPFAACAAL